MSNYPEHDKLSKVKDRTQAIREFLEWLSYEKGVQLAAYNDRGDRCSVAGIDQDELEREKRQMLEELRAMNERQP